eukprot:CAMPEP_0194376468 /NCGR_PEP_ID=MMETSP0174-20130528/25416_1 /TAXON_ID=216777 /ORGANISM="Proboscia alata, Strain PI-D3" /LENGTH=46 /DNA_ID= /DNA_START= /DNA_END= /DNA_ORIENTATION=
MGEATGWSVGLTMGAATGGAVLLPSPIVTNACGGTADVSMIPTLTL